MRNEESFSGGFFGQSPQAPAFIGLFASATITTSASPLFFPAQDILCVNITICSFSSCYFHELYVSAMDSCRFRFGTPSLPSFLNNHPSASPDSWSQPTTGGLFTFNSSTVSLPPDRHWWNKSWVPAIVVVFFVYSVMASVVLAWFLFMRSLEQTTRAVCREHKMAVIATNNNARVPGSVPS